VKRGGIVATVWLVGGAIGVFAGCPFNLPPIPAQCWCGEQWRAQIAGARAYDSFGAAAQIPASETSYTRCVTMLEHLALDGADPQDPIYMALRAALANEAIASCELAAAALLEQVDHTDCATIGTGSVSTNIVHIGACWEWEDVEAKPYELCPLEQQCDMYYDCSDEAISLWVGRVVDEGETEGDVYDYDHPRLLWTCDEPRDISGADTIRR
jgi:hypothetical protein